MGFRFRKSINLGGGVRLNLSKRGLGISAGVRGFRISHGPRGTRLTTTLVGTGLSHTEKIDAVKVPSALPVARLESPLSPTEDQKIVQSQPTTYCFNCHTQLPFAVTSCPACGRLVDQPVLYRPQYGYSRSHYRALIAGICLSVVLTSVAAWIGVAHWREQQNEAALRRERERQAHIAQSLHDLRVRYPYAQFTKYSEDGNPIPFNTSLSTCLVRQLNISRSGSTLDVNVEIVGIKPETQKPKVIVSVFDENGGFLSRCAIIDFFWSNFGQGEVREVDDKMNIPPDSQPAVVSVDEK